MVESMQIKVPTHFDTEADLVATVKAAGYDAEPFYGSIKTHFSSRKDFFTWELIDGVWTAIFSQADSKDLVTRFMRELEEKAGRPLFVKNSTTNKVEVIRTRTYPTNFSDGELLAQTLQEHGARVSRQENGNLTAHFGTETTLQFNAVENGPFNVEIMTDTPLQQTHGLLGELDENYREQVQQLTYRNLQERIAASPFTIASEEVLEDKTIVLTLNVTN